MLQDYFENEYVEKPEVMSVEVNIAERNNNNTSFSPSQGVRSASECNNITENYYKKILKEMKKTNKDKTRRKALFPKKWSKFIRKLIERSWPLILKECFSILKKLLFSGKKLNLLSANV